MGSIKQLAEDFHPHLISIERGRLSHIAEKVATLLRIRWPQSIGLPGHVPPEWVATFVRNTHRANDEEFV